jgi:hypothetical protein
MRTLSNDELAALILPWAKEHRPEPYQKTLAVARISATFRSYLARLVELRWEAEPEWRDSVPLRALEETALTVRMRHPALGVEVDVMGRLDPATRQPRSRRFSFVNMAEAIEAGVDFKTYLTIVEGFDLEVVE